MSKYEASFSKCDDGTWMWSITTTTKYTVYFMNKVGFAASKEKAEQDAQNWVNKQGKSFTKILKPAK